MKMTVTQRNHRRDIHLLLVMRWNGFFEDHTSTYNVIVFHVIQNNIALDEFEPSTTVLLYSLSPRSQGSVYSIYTVIVNIFSL
jgi:hypothetical protein